MRILLVASAFNSLSQRVFAELGGRGHRVAVALVAGEEEIRAAVRAHGPELVVAPILTTAIPADVWAGRICLVVHPGPPGDRGPSSLDHAIQDGAGRWGVTVLQAVAAMDAGPVWASAPFRVAPVGKSDLYRGEAADAALAALLLAVERFASGSFSPVTPREHIWRPFLRQPERRIDWAGDSTEAVLRKLRAADSRPGVLDGFLGGQWYLHGGHPEERLGGPPGAVLATRDGAICRATVDGAVWIPELRARRAPGGERTFRLPAVRALGGRLPDVPALPAPLWAREQAGTWAEIGYDERGAAGFLWFSFRGGAMGTEHCRRLLRAYRFACSRPTQVLVLGSARDFFCNGIHLGLIEAAADPATESLANIEAMDDLVEAVLTTTGRLTVAALGGNAAAGGVMLALAADEVWCRAGTVLNPHYRLMGLYGSEFWTYTLPRRVGAAAAERLMREALPVGAAAAARLGLVDEVVRCGPAGFAGRVTAMAEDLAGSPRLAARVAEKKAARERDEAARPLAAYRAAELARMRRVFDDPRAPYHALRSAFVRKERPPVTAPEENP